MGLDQNVPPKSSSSKDKLELVNKQPLEDQEAVEEKVQTYLAFIKEKQEQNNLTLERVEEFLRLLILNHRQTVE